MISVRFIVDASYLFDVLGASFEFTSLSYLFFIDVIFSKILFCFTEMMLVVDQSKRADIFQVANFAFQMTGRPSPVRNISVCLTVFFFNLDKLSTFKYFSLLTISVQQIRFSSNSPFLPSKSIYRVNSFRFDF